MDERRNVGGEREKMAGEEFQADFILPRVGYSRVYHFTLLLDTSYSLVYGINYLVYRSTGQ